MKRSVARQAGVIVACSVVMAAIMSVVLGQLGFTMRLPLGEVLVGTAIVAPCAGLVAWLMSTRLLGARLAHLVAVIDATGPNDDLARIRNLGLDEVGAIGNAVNGLLARLTRIRASMIEQERELVRAQRELELSQSLAAKTEELKARLDERAMLFDLLRMTSSSPELDQVLHTLVERVGQLLKLREVVIFIQDENNDEYFVRAAYGFAKEGDLLGRSVKGGEGLSGQVGQTRAPLVVADVSQSETFMGFWGHAPREGSLAAVPILYQQRLLGILTVTRPEQDPITELHLNLLMAIADNAALAIHNAQLFERMRELSTHDELTNLANRRLFRHHLGQEVDRARRFEKSLSLIALDIDHFKQLNDRHGHPRGDLALRDFAKLLEASVRKVDTVARVGGEEFMILLPRADVREAAQVAEKLRALVMATPFAGGADQPEGALTVSLGVAELATTDDNEGDSLVERADQALYAAKHAGRNCVFANDAPHAIAPD